jgi:cytochrome c biogenesis protein CcmG/thiol:disulfide interchange protein DsbE
MVKCMRIILMLLTSALLLTACSDNETGQTPSSADSFPEFTLRDPSGADVTRDDLKGPALVHVYASWCPTCNAEAPELAPLLQKYPELNMVYIAVADDPEDAATWLKEKDFPLDNATIVIDEDRELAGELGLSGQPHTLLVDKDLGITKRYLGPAPVEDLTRDLDTL